MLCGRCEYQGESSGDRCPRCGLVGVISLDPFGGRWLVFPGASDDDRTVVPPIRGAVVNGFAAGLSGLVFGGLAATYLDLLFVPVVLLPALIYTLFMVYWVIVSPDVKQEHHGKLAIQAVLWSFEERDGEPGLLVVARVADGEQMEQLLDGNPGAAQRLPMALEVTLATEAGVLLPGAVDGFRREDGACRIRQCWVPPAGWMGMGRLGIFVPLVALALDPGASTFEGRLRVEISRGSGRRSSYDRPLSVTLDERARALLAKRALHSPDRGRPPEPRPVAAAAPADASCQVCGGRLLVDLVACLRCESPSHRDCWEYAGGCVTYACPASSSVEAR